MPNWGEVLQHIGNIKAAHRHHAEAAFDLVRREYLKKLSEYTGRNVIAYYSGFLSKPNILQAEINDEDKNGFMATIHGLDRDKGLDLILHTPGGGLAATQSIVHYLHQMFDHNIRAIVPQMAMSGGTILACSTKSILMGKESNLGPVDPQIRGIPAYGVIEEFKRAHKDIKNDTTMAYVWRPILEQYHPTFLLKCENTIDASKKFVESQLLDVMFYRVPHKKQKVRTIVNQLSDYKKGHDRHLHIDECEQMGLKIERLEDDNDLQDLVLTVHHCFMHTINNTRAFKMIENHNGTATIKNHGPN